MTLIKFKYTIQTGKGIVELVLTLDEIEKGGLNLINYSMPRKVISREQFTGLHDVNGIDVYSHDILLLNNSTTLEVQWDYRSTGWCTVDISDYKKEPLYKMLLASATVTKKD